MHRYSACIEMLFADETDDFLARIAMARDAGFAAVEFWRWTSKDLDAVAAAVAEAGMPVAGLLAEPTIPLTDPANRPAFLEGLAQSVEVARRLGAPLLIGQAGDDLPGRPREEQRAALVACLRAAVPLLEGTGVVFGLEPLNIHVDHKGYFLPSTVEALDIVDEIDSPSVRIVYDIYHSAVMGERTEDVLGERIDRVAHVHVADHPGRHEPGTGTVDLRERLDRVFALGYDGLVGLEYRPQARTSSQVAATFAALG